ncbi:TIGR03792 family protein [Synechococcus sp. FGCU-3]|nr:TIGR03792 family protein [Synechococcus sp. FGCU3]
MRHGLQRRLHAWLGSALAAALAFVIALGLAQAANAASGDYGVVVVEHLRVKVPAEAVDDWLQAEQGSWEPWLAKQPGFLDRQLLWDPEREEGTLLIHWRSREAWKAIPEAEIEAVQERFEQLAREATGRRQGNPFPLVFEGELLPR